MDLGSLESVRAGAEEFLRRSGGRLNVLVNNAGMCFHLGLLIWPRGKRWLYQCSDLGNRLLTYRNHGLPPR